MRVMPRRGLALLLAAFSLQGTMVSAQLPTPQLTSIYPPGAKQGAAVDLAVAGADLDGVDVHLATLVVVAVAEEPEHHDRRIVTVLGVDQRLHLAAVLLNVGIEVGTSSHDHADALDLDVGDAQPGRDLADLPLELDRLAAGLVEPAVDDGDAVGPIHRLADLQGLAAVLAEALAVGLGLGALGRLDEARLLDRKSTRLNSSHIPLSRMPSSA